MWEKIYSVEEMKLIFESFPNFWWQNLIHSWQVKVWFQNRRMKWRHQESKERREGRLETGESGWSVSTNVFSGEYKTDDEDDDDDDEDPVVADSTVDKDGPN